MATAANIIARSMRLLGQISSGEDPSTEEYADGLTALNAMLGTWNNPRLMCYALQEESLTLSSGDSSYTIGPSGDVNTTRPVAIESAYVVDSSNLSHEIRLISDKAYAALPNKTQTAPYPTHAVYRPSMATGTLLLWPVPDGTVTSMKLLTRIPLTSFSTTSDTVSLPPGWEEALAYNLAIRLAPEFETEPGQSVIEIARDSLAAIKTANKVRMIADTGLSGSSGYNVLTDQ